MRYFLAILIGGGAVGLLMARSRIGIFRLSKLPIPAWVDPALGPGSRAIGGWAARLRRRQVRT